MVKINLRMNLSHFLNKSYEKEVMKKLDEIHLDKIIFYLKLWYEDGTVTPEDLKRFLMEYESNLHFKTVVKVGNELKPNEFVWYDIIDVNSRNLNNLLRFEYIYNKKEHILDGLDEFHKCAKFCTSEKPPKRQKRNDYESSYSRK